jgi:predicted O-linked N-acetylglucosamine transferase (SPINDLY family)
VPVLTMAGESFASRVASSILSAVELPELITYSTLEYEKKAIELEKDYSKLEKIKEKLQNNKNNMRLFDTPNFTRSLERAYFEIHSRSKKGLPLEHIHCDE